MLSERPSGISGRRNTAAAVFCYRGTMAHLIELAPQIAVALAIVAAVIMMNRQVVGMAKSLTKPNGNGERTPRLQAVEEVIATHTDALQRHEKWHRKGFAALHLLQSGQDEILEHITAARRAPPRRIPEDIDDADTAEFSVPDDI